MKTISNKLFPFIVLFFSVSLVSCLNSEVEIDEPRTQADELSDIANFITTVTEQGYTVEETADGLYYIIHEEGEGEHPQAGDTLDILYQAFFFNGSILDASYYHYTDSIWTHIYKNQELPMIDGFDKSLALTRKGSLHDFILPSDLAYGPYGTDLVPPYTPLIFRIEMRNIRFLSE